MDEIRSRHLETMVETTAYRYLQGNRIIPGFLNGGAKWIGSTHNSPVPDCTIVFPFVHCTLVALWEWVRFTMT